MENRLDAAREGEKSVGVRKTERVIKESVNFRVMFYSIYFLLFLSGHAMQREG